MPRKLAFFAVCVTYILLLWGGMVHNTESSLACPDWPLCYGQFFPKMEGGILIEHGHRLLASLVGLLSIGLVFLAGRKKSQVPKNFPKGLPYLALVMVILQGVLGGITVIYRLPTIVSTLHLGLSLIFFCTLILIHHKLSAPTPVEGGPKAGLKWAMALAYVQMLLGAFMRHSGAGLACGGGTENAFTCLDSTLWKHVLWPTEYPAQLHMLHRGLGLIVLVQVLFSLWHLPPSLKNWSRALALTLFIQVGLGFLVVAQFLAVVPTTLHLGGAALVLGLLWKMNLFMVRPSAEKKPRSKLRDFIELTKPKLSALVMLTVLAGMQLSPERISFGASLWALFLIALAVAGAGALNCYIEREIDSKMQRTQNRPLPSGRMAPSMALIFGTSICLISILLLCLSVNLATGLLALGALGSYLFLYTPLKKKSEMAVYVGAIPGAIPPVLGLTSVTGHIDPMGRALFLILLVWQLPHFLSISIMHKKDYDAAGLKVYPNLHGVRATKVYMVILTAILAGVALLPATWGNLGPIYGEVALILSVAFLLLAARGTFRFRDENQQWSWARAYFWGSIVYLPALLCAMLFFQ